MASPTKPARENRPASLAAVELASRSQAGQPAGEAALSHESFRVECSLPQQRYDAFLRERYPQVSRGALQRMLVSGDILVNGRQVKPAHHPAAGDEVAVTWRAARPAELTPEDIPLEVLYEDEALVVINKPAGLVTHPAAGNQEHTLVQALLHHCAGQLSGIGGVARPGIVHRLDKDTSGCLVAAKNDAAHQALAAQFQARTVHKVYHAVVCGHLRAENGRILAGISRHPTHRKRMTVAPGAGRAAHTDYRVLERLREATLVEAVLHTGRTHQIRVHFQHLGHPLLGDGVYGGRQSRRLAESLGLEVPRQMLHAQSLHFYHPLTGRRLVFEAAWPEDFAQVVQALRA